MRVGMLVFPHLTQLDLTGPHEVLARAPGFEVLLVAATREPVRSENGLVFVPDATLADAPPLDVLFVPGGAGIAALLADAPLLALLRARGEAARWVTSVCTGALVLGAAGLLDGYNAATHWLSMELLPLVGAIPVEARVVIDRNRITGGGVTAGIDFGLSLVATIAGEPAAREIQLMIEYAPAPPFDSGSPRTASPALVAAVRDARRAIQDRRRAALTKGGHT